MSEDVPSERSVGQRLLRLRRERGLSQQQLAGSGLSTAQVSRIEAGKRQPSVRAIRLLGSGAPRVSRVPGDRACDDRRRVARAAPGRCGGSYPLRRGSERAARRAGRRLHENRAGRKYRSARPRARRSRLGGGESESQPGGRESVSSGRSRQEMCTLLPIRNVFTALARTYWLLDDYERYASLMESCLQRLAECPVRRDGSRAHDVHDPAQLRALVPRRVRPRPGSTPSGERGGRAASGPVRPGAALLVASVVSRPPKETLPSALEYARRSIALLETSEDDVHLGRAHLLCGADLQSRRSGGGSEQATRSGRGAPGLTYRADRPRAVTCRAGEEPC